MAPIGKPKRRIKIEPLPEPRRREMPAPAPREPEKDPATPQRERVAA